MPSHHQVSFFTWDASVRRSQRRNERDESDLNLAAKKYTLKRS
ncbi:predicted protein [Botrytis cinerea T4]|uniref:Uncharacterized protein n=1 Tax=Botryotinia fuckeliana (strain T4) TaxID=999810 RepID=G2Y6X9_BOTF4|nr:predicted protein [Botrytis cinerea T4]